MNVRLRKLRYFLAAVRSKLFLFSRHPSALLFYVRHYAGERPVARPPDVVVVSYPKSGRTWLEQLMLASLGHHTDRRFDESATYSNEATKSHGLPLVVFTHAGSSWETAMLTAEEIANHIPQNLTNRRFIYLYRDPRDVLVSAYHHARHRSQIHWLRQQDMLDDPIVGLPKLVAFMNNWRRQTESAGTRAMRISYEELREKPHLTFPNDLQIHQSAVFQRGNPQRG